MTSIIVAFPKLEDAKNMKNLLVRNGFSVAAVCTTGSQTIGQADHLSSGIVICSYKLSDMIYSQLHEYLPPGFEMLLMASPHILAGCRNNDIVCLETPLKIYDMVNTVEMMIRASERRRKHQKSKPKERDEKEEALIEEAKQILMHRNNMTEEEAHRYIQKCSMDSSTNMTETAQMILFMNE
ncbi:response regulator NasT [Kineothrix alysoides]|uniref:Response regulator NasT n=1 Tax=Kineothrix alysoides TaxID=1469948 RepID=A0A4R1R4Y7_9FIRM|nr:ANTAR domain-containing protein [Kineothrix alysoides]TCL60332.1 response regulator NasT [Kineothrix alysoides]